jgi:alcohol dehydrogenase (cytochrome c)
MKSAKVWLFTIAGILLVFAGLVATVHGLRWRATVVALKVSGELPDVPSLDMLRWLAPGSHVYLGDLTVRPTAEAGILNIFLEDSEYAKRGEQQYRLSCAVCHGANAQGGTGPNLIAYVSRFPDWGFFRAVKWGRKGTSMAAQAIGEQKIWEIHSYLRQQTRAWSRDAAAHNPNDLPVVDVPYERLANAAAHPEEWLMYTGDLKAHRHSSLKQINRGNVKNLRVAWAAQLRPAEKPLAATPIVVGSTMFVTEAPDGVVALDARNGRLLWRFSRPVDPSQLPVCCGAYNRGVAVLGKRVYVATLDSYLVALDAATGQKVWEVQVADEKLGYTMTTAPLVLKDKIVVGVAGGELGARGLLAAYSPDDGKRLWQFFTVPGPGEPGHDTWAGDSWKTGGATTWSIGAYDAELDLLYWTTGNPWPLFDYTGREGDNLYTNSILALDPNTGKLRWHFQTTPADAHDWDATQQVVLADVQWKGETVPAAIMANRNAFYYVLDRRDGKFLYTKPYVKQNWALSIDDKGRPVRDPKTIPTPEGALVYPWLHGGTNWWPPSYDPKRKLHYVPTVDAASTYFSIKEKLKPGTMTMRGTTQLASNLPAVVAVKAIDPDTGDIRWSTRLDEGDFVQFARVTGLLSTDGDIVLGGFMDRISIMDSDNGSILWNFRPGALVNAGPSTYSIDGVQYFALLAGNVLFAFSLPPAEGAPANRK